MDCVDCRDGILQDETHVCYRVGHRFHERRDLLYYFNEALENSMDILTMDFYLADIQTAVYKNLLKLNYPDYDICCIKITAEYYIDNKERELCPLVFQVTLGLTPRPSVSVANTSHYS